MRSRPFRIMKLSDQGEHINPAQGKILGICSTDMPLTGPQIAARLCVPCDGPFREALVGLVRMGRLARPYGKHGYLLVRCRR